MGQARKAWADLSPAYQKRLQRGGVTEANYDTPEGRALRTAARGHGQTPERPERAVRNPSRYRQYVQSRDDESRQLIARKERIFGDRIKYRRRGSEANAMTNPQTDARPNASYVRRFLRMTEDDIAEIDWSDDEWGFLFYH